MIGTRRRAGRRPDASVFLGQEILMGEGLALAVAPLVTYALVKALGESFGQPVGERFSHDGIVIVVPSLEGVAHLFEAEPGAHRETANMVGKARTFRRNEIAKRPVRLPLFLFFVLLTQEAERPEHILPRVVCV